MRKKRWDRLSMAFIARQSRLIWFQDFKRTPFIVWYALHSLHLQFLNLDYCKSIGELEFFPLVCSAISHVHVLLNAGERERDHIGIGPLQDPVTWYGINYAGTQITLWDFQNKGTRTSPARLSFVLKAPLRYLCPSIIYFVPCDRILQRAYWSCYEIFL